MPWAQETVGRYTSKWSGRFRAGILDASDLSLVIREHIPEAPSTRRKGAALKLRLVSLDTSVVAANGLSAGIRGRHRSSYGVISQTTPQPLPLLLQFPGAAIEGGAVEIAIGVNPADARRYLQLRRRALRDTERTTRLPRQNHRGHAQCDSQGVRKKPWSTLPAS